MKTHCFFAHIAFARDARARATPQATVNLLIEINDTALRSGGKKKHLNVPALLEPQRLELAAEIAKTAARDYLKSKHEFRRFPVQRFVDFNLTISRPYFDLSPSDRMTFGFFSLGFRKLPIRRAWDPYTSTNNKYNQQPLSRCRSAVHNKLKIT